jgi:hypothetical protein
MKKNAKKNVKPFGKFRTLVVASTIAGLGTIMAAGAGCSSGGPPRASCDPCVTEWNYAHGGQRSCGPHSCGGMND